jgi:hypothetical protein
MKNIFLYTKQDLIDLVQRLKDYTSESRTILGHDDREANEFVEIFLNEKFEEEPKEETLKKSAENYANHDVVIRK